MKTPLIVIVGRPNVGKSTLFNRLTKSNDSIVDDYSGVTRDRIYGEVDWNGQLFRVMDTGGYVPDSTDQFEIAIKEQVEIAIEEADAILFVTDGRAGVTPIDWEISALLRASEKPSVLLVNKSDNVTQGMNKADFYSLGLEHVEDISALSGRRVGDFLDVLTKEVEIPQTVEIEDDRLKIAILGRPNVGKSSLTNSLLGYDRSIVTDIPGTTRDSIDSILKYNKEEFVLIDTAGLRKKARVKENLEFYSNVRTYRAIAECDIAFILLDSILGLEKQDQRIIDEAIRRRKGIILAVNKWDLIEKETNTSKGFETKILDKLGTASFIPIKFISALTKQRIYKLLDVAKEIQASRKKKVSTNELNEILLPDIMKTPPPATKTGKTVSIKYITQVGDKYPIFLVFTNEPNEIQDNYRRFIEKQIRFRFGFTGVPITVSFKGT